MTQFFTYSGFSLRRAPTPIRVLLTSFIALATTGFAVGILNYQVRTGLSSRGSAAWYRQGIAASTRDERTAAEAADVGARDEPTGELEGKTPLELLDATHPHLFNQAFLFFVLGHVLALCALPAALKNAVYGAAFAGVLVDASSPWLIRYAAPEFAWLQLVGHLLLTFALLALVVLPLREMWTPLRTDVEEHSPA